MKDAKVCKFKVTFFPFTKRLKKQSTVDRSWVYVDLWTCYSLTIRTCSTMLCFPDLRFWDVVVWNLIGTNYLFWPNHRFIYRFYVVSFNEFLPLLKCNYVIMWLQVVLILHIIDLKHIAYQFFMQSMTINKL